VKCKNGYVYECKPPDLVIAGLVMGERIMNFEGKAEVICEKSKLVLEGLLNYNEDGMFKRIFFVFFQVKRTC